MAERTLAQNVAQAVADFKAIKDIVNEATSDGDNIPRGTPTSQYAEKIDQTFSKVFSQGESMGDEAGYNRGYEEGYTAGAEEGGNNEEIYQEGFEAGQKSEYDKFWDAFQDYGKRTNYEYAFYNGFGGWDEWFYPKYDIVPINAGSMFRYNTNLNLKEALAKNNVKLDFSQCTNIGACFNYANIGDLPEINTKSLSSIPSCFNTCKSKKIDKFILKDDGSQIFDSTFAAYQSLQDIVFEGVIGQDLKLNPCTNLSKASIENTVSVLSATATGKTLSISKTAKEREFTTDEWATLIATKPNWTFSLV